MPPRLVVVGSLMMDLVVRAPRLPVAGESLLSHSFQTSPGGKGANQAIAAARLGAEVTCVGRVGSDRFGTILREGLENACVDTTHISIDPGVGTGVAVPIVLDSGDNAIFAVPQANMSLTPEHIEGARSAIESADMLLVQFEVGMAATEHAMLIARGASVPVLLNPAPIAAFPDGMLDLASLVVANEVEAAALAPEAAGDHVRELTALRAHAARAVITLGADGAVFSEDSGTGTVEAFNVESIDSVGAGDAFCGALAIALCEGRSLPEAVCFASAAGAIAVTRAGAQSSLPTRAEVEAFLAAR